MAHIMLVDDEPSVTEALKRSIKKAHKDWEVDTFSDPEVALTQLRSKSYHVIISDYKMGAVNGVTFLSESKIFQKKAKRIILSGQQDTEALISAINSAEIYRYLCKPVESSEIILAIEHALLYQNIENENEHLIDKVRQLEEDKKNHEKKLHQISQMNSKIKELIQSVE